MFEAINRGRCELTRTRNIKGAVLAHANPADVEGLCAELGQRFGMVSVVTGAGPVFKAVHLYTEGGEVDIEKTDQVERGVVILLPEWPEPNVRLEFDSGAP